MTKTIRSAIHTRALHLGALLCLAAAPAALAGCDDPVRAARAADVEVRGDPFVEVGGTLQLTAVVTDAQGAELSGRRVTWESSNPAVAAVQDGVVTGRSLGRATVTATSGDAVDSVLVTVEPVVGSVVVLPAATTVAVGVTAQVSAVAVNPGNTGNLTGVTLRWSTSNPAVAVADSGRVRGVGVGTTEVIVAAGSRTGRFTLEVVRPYAVTRLGLPGQTEGQAHAINASGTVVGQSVVEGRQQAWVWSSGAITPLGEGRALDVNDAGVVVGASGADAVMWSGGARTVLFTREGGFAWADAINNRGQAAGSWMSSSGCGPGGRCNGTAWLYSAGAAREIVPLDINPTAGGINDQGWVVGSVGSDVRGDAYSFIYRDGTLTRLPGQSGTYVARDINERGEIVGGAPAVRWTDPQANPSPLPVLSQFQSRSVAYGINERGDVAGHIQNFGLRGVLWRDGKALDLSYLFVDPEWTIEHATDINDRGQIVGQGRHRASGATGALLLTPPAP
jgi:hypothetical protein